MQYTSVRFECDPNPIGRGITEFESDEELASERLQKREWTRIVDGTVELRRINNPHSAVFRNRRKNVEKNEDGQFANRLAMIHILAEQLKHRQFRVLIPQFLPQLPDGQILLCFPLECTSQLEKQ